MAKYSSFDLEIPALAHTALTGFCGAAERIVRGCKYRVAFFTDRAPAMQCDGRDTAGATAMKLRDKAAKFFPDAKRA